MSSEGLEATEEDMNYLEEEGDLVMDDNDQAIVT